MGSARVDRMGLVVHVHTEEGEGCRPPHFFFFPLAGLVSFFLVLVYRIVVFLGFVTFLGFRFGRAARGEA